MTSLLLGGILLAGLLVRTAGLQSPITGVRETQSAMIARNLLADGPLGILYPRVDYGGDQPGYTALEMPIVNALGAAVHTVVPSLGDSSFKIPSLFFWLLGSLFLFDLARRRIGPGAALFSVAVYALLPLNAEMSASPMPDAAGLALTTGAVALLDRYAESRCLATAAGAFSLGAVALLVKSTNIYVAFPMIGLLLARRGFRVLVEGRVLALTVLALAPLALWLWHSREVNAASELFGEGRTVERANLTWLFQRGRTEFYASPLWYATIGRRLLEGNTIAGLAAAAIGCVLALRRGSGVRGMVAWWALGLAAYCAALPQLVYTHHYYLLPAAALVALLAGLALDRAGRRLGPRALPWALGLVLLVPVAIEGPPRAMAKLRTANVDKVAFGEAARRVVPEGSLVVISAYTLPSWDGSLFYQSGRRGWKYSAHVVEDSEVEEHRRKRRALGTRVNSVPPAVDARYALTPDRLEALRLRGAAYFAYFGRPSEWVEEQRDLACHVLERYPVVEIERRWLFVDMREPRDVARLESPGNGGDTDDGAGFALAGTGDAPDSLDGRSRRLLGGRVLGEPDSPEREARQSSGDGEVRPLPFAGLIPAATFEAGTVLFEYRAAGEPGKRAGEEKGP
jgi:hypothetical protein